MVFLLAHLVWQGKRSRSPNITSFERYYHGVYGCKDYHL